MGVDYYQIILQNEKFAERALNTQTSITDRPKISWHLRHVLIPLLSLEHVSANLALWENKLLIPPILRIIDLSIITPVFQVPNK